MRFPPASPHSTGGVAPEPEEDSLSVSCPVDLDTMRLRRDVAAMYARVATSPEGSFHFHRGGGDGHQPGCGAGMDLLLASKRVGPAGRVIGVDMTAEIRRGRCERRGVETMTRDARHVAGTPARVDVRN